MTTGEVGTATGTIASQPRPGLTVSRARRQRAGSTAIGPVVWLAIVWVAIVIVVALTAQWLPVHSPTIVVGVPDQGLNLSREFLGTDAIGRSILSRVAFGARVSIGISFIATAASMLVGGLIGLITAYFGRWLTWLADVVTTAVLSVPTVLLLLAIVVALRPSLPTITGAMSLVFLPAFMRITRANSRLQLSRDYVLAARALGAGSARIMFRDVAPNITPALLAYASAVLPTIMVTEGSLSFLGFGVQPPTPSWGEMIAQGQTYLATAPTPALVPCAALLITVFSLCIIGDYVRRRFDVRGVQL